MPKKTVILTFVVFIVGLITIANIGFISDTLFLPDRPLYFFKEWTRNYSIILTNDESARMENRLKFSLEKITELRKVSQEKRDIKGSLANYLSEVEKLRLASESLRGINNEKLSQKIVSEAFFERAVLSEVLDTNKLDRKNYALVNSFENFMLSASYIGNDDSVFLAIKKYVNNIEGDDNKIKELDNISAYFSGENFRKKIFIAEMDIVKQRMTLPFDNESTQNYFNNKIAELQKSDFYTNWLISIDEKRQKELTDKIVKGEWMDEVFENALGEEIEPLEFFRNKLAETSIEKLDSKIDNLDVYEETREALKQAKNELITSIYGDIEISQVMGTLHEEQIDIDSQKLSPASAYCIRMGYKIEQRTSEDDIIYNACVSDDGQECEDLAFYKKECEIK
ncbi:DUF333 domain-containing protein [bacterium]|nr:DUF333 domain-containing protein [bacterium]